MTRSPVAMLSVIVMALGTWSGPATAASFSLQWSMSNSYPGMAPAIICSPAKAYSAPAPYAAASSYSLSTKGQGLKVNGTQVTSTFNPTTCDLKYSGKTSLYSYSSARWDADLHPNMLHVGVNKISFKDDCLLDTADRVTLTGAGFSTQLFFVPCWLRPAGGNRTFGGVAPMSLTLRQLNPALHEALQRLIESIKQRLKKMQAKLDKAKQEQAKIAQKMAAIDALKAKTRKLLDQGFDKLTPAALDALLVAYDNIDPDLRKQLVKLVQDLKMELAKLNAEIQKVMALFSKRMKVVDDLVAKVAQQAGYGLDDLASFKPLVDFGEAQDVDVPDILGEETFGSKNDPYDTYAQEVITQLQATVKSGTVVDREGFFNIVAAWRHNQEALSKMLSIRSGVSAAEFKAFLTATELVVSFLKTYMDKQYWFKDSQVPPDLRLWVDTELMQRFKSKALMLKKALVQLKKQQSPDQQRLFATLSALMGWERGLADLKIGGSAEQAYQEAFNQALIKARQIATSAAALVPYLGTYVAICEFATGDAGCVSGAKLSLPMRAVALVGIIPLGKIIKKIGWAVSGLAAKVGSKGAKLADVLSDLPFDVRRTLAKRMKKFDGKAIGNLSSGLSGKELKSVMDTWGDDVVNALAKKMDGPAIKKLRQYCY